MTSGPGSTRAILSILTALVILIVLVGARVFHAVHNSPVAVTHPSEVSTSTCAIDASEAHFAARHVLEDLAGDTFLSLTPISRSMAPVNPTYTQQFSYEGISLSVPWAGTPETQSREGVGTQIRFRDGNFVMLVNPYPFGSMLKEFLASAKTAQDQSSVECLFGGSDPNTNAAFFNLVVSSNLYALASSSASPQDLWLQSILLPLKLILFYDSSTQGIYEFSSPNFNVVEFSDWPVQKISYIFLFDSQDRGRLITTSASQREIDFIVSSIHE